MHEYVTVSASSYDPGSLASKLNEKSAEGWDVVAIVPTGGDVTAFLRRAAGAAMEPTMAPAAMEPTMAAMAMGEAAASAAVAAEPAAHMMADAMAPVAEPAGWGAAPDPAPAPDMAASSAPATIIQSASPGVQIVAAASGPAVPAGWYADPAGRYDLRYWDGGQWTEHVARGGQQYTDPPVA